MTPLVSVIIPTYRRNGLLNDCLAAVVAQDFDAADYEVIVVDDGCDRETERLVQRWAAHAVPAIRYLAMDRQRGPAAARNAGWRAARGAWVAFTDDDCRPDAAWLQAGMTACTGEVAAVAGRVEVPLPACPTDYQRDAARLGEAGFVTANCFCRRDVLARVGGFDERFVAAWREDSDLYFTLLETGCQVVEAPDARVVHPIRSAAWGISLRQQRKNTYNALLYKKHRQLYRGRIQKAPPWRYYAAVISLATAMMSGLAGVAWLAAAAALAWMTLTARFCLDRLQQTSRSWGHVVEMALTSALIPPLAVFWRLWGALKFRVLFL